MNRTRLLVALVLADIVLAFSVIGSELFFSWTLPKALQDYAFGRPLSLWGGREFALMVLWALTVTGTFVAWVGLLNLWRFARKLYLWAWLAWFVLLVWSGPSVSTGLGAMLSTAESAIGGAILALVYFSDLSRHFERPMPEIARRPEPATRGA